MKHVLQIIAGMTDQSGPAALSAYLSSLCQRMSYHSCLIKPKTLGWLPTPLGHCSAALELLLQQQEEQIWQDLPAAGTASWLALDYPALLGVRLRQPQTAVLLVEPALPLNTEQQQGLLMFWQLLVPYLEQTLLSQQQAALQLTARELQCIGWAAASKTSWEISKILGISERTVNFHIQNSLQKSGALNRTQLVQWCRELGLVDF